MGRRLRIGVDGVFIRKQGKGVSRLLVSFLNTFANNHWTDIELVVFVNRGEELSELPLHRNIQYVPVQVVKLLVWDFYGFNHYLQAADVDLVFTLSDRVRINKKYLMYVIETPDYRIAANKENSGYYQCLSDQFTKWFFPKSIGNAEHLITSSVSTKDDLVYKYGVPKEKLSVVYLSQDPDFRRCNNLEKIKAIRLKYGAEEGYMLHFSSNNDPRDNTGTLLKAVALSAKKFNHRKKIIIVGIDCFKSFGWEKLLYDLDLTNNILFAGFVPQPNLIELYQAADVYIDTSLYEGFGLQVAEAMACGVPVICSNVTSLPEVSGDAAILVSPMDIEGIANAIVSVISDSQLATKLAQKSLIQASRFSWYRTASELITQMHNIAST